MKRKIIYILALLLYWNSTYAQKGIVCLAHGYQPPTSFDTSRFHNACAGLSDNHYLWDNGKTFYVSFLNGSRALQEKVKKASRKWEAIANIKFEFVDIGRTNIRLVFTNNGYISSMIGVMAAMVAQNDATMNIDTTDFNNSLYAESVVLHLFGHVLGLQDNIQAPLKSSEVTEKQVSVLFSKMKLENKTEEQNAFLQKITHGFSNSLKYDGLSVMAWPTTGFLVKQNVQLSAADKKLIEACYPKKNDTTYRYAVPSFKFFDLKVVDNVQRNGISFYPVFDIENWYSYNGIHFFVTFTYGDGGVIKTESEEYNISQQLGVYKETRYPIYSAKGINAKQLSDLELFIPYQTLQVIDKTRKVFATFKVYYKDQEKQGWLCQSKPFEVKL